MKLSAISPPGDWLYYDEQFRFIRQSAPAQCPWDAIHWEPWLRAVTNFRPKTQFSPDKGPLRSRSQSFPRGTCWRFHAGKVWTGCRFEHICYKCGSKHPAAQCSSSQPKTHLVKAGISNVAAQAINTRKGGSTYFFLSGYETSLRRHIFNGFTFGFHVGFDGERCALHSPNLKSALDQPQIVRTKLRKECEAGRICGPFICPPFPNFVCSPLGIVPKKDPSEFRLIQHLSYPQGTSVNDNIPDAHSSVHYASISDAIAVLKSLGAGFFLVKTDIISAFRIIPIHPSDFSLLGMKWDNQFYFDVFVRGTVFLVSDF